MKKLLTHVPTLIVLACIGLLGFAATALAADTVVPADSSSWLDLLTPVFNAFSGGHYAYAGALLVIAIVALVKRYLGDKWAWMHSDAGGAGLALVAATATAVAAALAAPGATLSLGLLKTAALVGVGAAGGYTVIKSLLIEPVLRPLAAKLPAWAQPICTVVFWLFDKSETAAQAEALKKADAAGTAAVAAAAKQGLASVVGQPTDVK